ncbi:sentrin-specific protease 7b isoform X2 [Austrofundulus limnaeus]|uniref:Sentrin-specific protease 7b isoform X2 n=1 Tax=Austrofundulus limnaeus TaxID=52670 RepID=A0A2I4C862_AUSLI|nr:PREDICTED: sentrin-specific protease 7 isoform X2 [Austrofundulus limnaeus]
MASPFKIPKKKHPLGSDSAHLHMQSPLSRLHNSASQKGFGGPSSRGGTDRMHAGNSLGSSTVGLRSPFRTVVKTLLGISSSNGGGASGANHRTPGSRSSQSQLDERGTSMSNGWRPKRASDRLLQPTDLSEHLSPPQKKKSPECSESVDSLAELRAEEHAGSFSSSVSQRKTESSKDVKHKNLSSSEPNQTSEDNLVSPHRTMSDSSRPCSSSSVSPMKVLPSQRKTPDRRQYLDLKKDVLETQRDRWRQFRERKTRSSDLHLRLKKPKQTPIEPIVLSSEEEEEEEEEHGEVEKTTQSSSRVDQKENSEKLQVSTQLDAPPPSFLQLEFCSLHAGLMEAEANGPITITENEIIIPVKGQEDSQVTVVASQLRGYGVWDGGVAQSGTLLTEWEGPAPSLLFLWVSEPQANLLQRELLAVQSLSAAANAPSCCVLLLVLKEQLQELQTALLTSILDMEEYKQARSSSSPIDWTDGLLLVHSCPPPVDQHLLRLLGHSAKSSQPSGAQKSSAPQLQLPSRLIQYPLVQCKGRITVTEEDLACLDAGEFLNDVIIDFYLKYLLLEGVCGTVAQRSHVFSSFFYKQLSRRRVAGEDEAPSIPDRHMRHQRVKTWTRHIDIFTKDFLFVPVNQEAHWFLVVVCFAGLEEVQTEKFQARAGGSGRTTSKLDLSLKCTQPPECTEQGCEKDTVTKRPCILVMDSLKLSYHNNVCRLIRDYLQVEWEVRRKSPRHFTSDNMRSCSCRVPQQDNSSDCGVYLLQYVESFLQNPVVDFDLPLQLQSWFPRQQVRQKREEIRNLILKLHRTQSNKKNSKTSLS